MRKKKDHDEDPDILDPGESWELKKKEDMTLEEEIEIELLKNRIVILHGELMEENCDKISKRLLFLYCKGVKEIDVILNSVGGEVYHSLLIFNTMEDLKKKGMVIHIEARGVCASMGVILLMAGSTRSASKYTRFLLHELSSWAYGKASEVKEESAELTKVNKMLDNIISEKTSLTPEKLRKNTRKKDWWLSAEEALKYGIIEKIV